MNRKLEAKLAGDSASIEAARAQLVKRPAYLLNRGYQISSSGFAPRNQKAELTAAQFEALAVVSSRPGLDQITLARQLGIDRSTTTVVLDGLARRSLVVRTNLQSDRRKKLLLATPKAPEILQATRSYAEAAEVKMMQSLTATRKNEVLRLLYLIASDQSSPAPSWIPLNVHSATVDDSNQQLDWLYSRLHFLFRRCVQSSDALFLEEAARFGLTQRQYGALFMVERAGCIDQVSVAYLMRSDRSTVALLLKVLEAQGLVVRMTGTEDRRQRMVSATPAGRDLLVDCRPHEMRAEDRLLARLSPKEAARFCDLLRVVVAPYDVDGPAN